MLGIFDVLFVLRFGLDRISFCFPPWFVFYLQLSVPGSRRIYIVPATCLPWFEHALDTRIKPVPFCSEVDGAAGVFPATSYYKFRQRCYLSQESSFKWYSICPDIM